MKGVKGILLMGGKGERFYNTLPKQFHLLSGKPIYLWTVEKFYSSHLFEELILVCLEEHLELVQSQAPHCTVIPGGTTRQESSYKGLLACTSPTDIVVIHDAVRPFVSQRILKENIEQARKYQAVDTCIPSSDTIVYAPSGKTIEAIPSRKEYLRGQTPQSFSYPLILKAHQQTQKKNATDDCQLILELRSPVHIVVGEEENFKITTPLDLLLAEKKIKEEKT